MIIQEAYTIKPGEVVFLCPGVSINGREEIDRTPTEDFNQFEGLLWPLIGWWL